MQQSAVEWLIVHCPLQDMEIQAEKCQVTCMGFLWPTNVRHALQVGDVTL